MHGRQGIPGFSAKAESVALRDPEVFMLAVMHIEEIS
jgi:hypothetical protein